MEYKINVQNVHLAEVEEIDGKLSFKKPEAIIGAMEIGREPQIANGELYGDGKIRHKDSKKVGYKLNMDMNKIPTKWRRYFEGVTVENGVESGASKDIPNHFAAGWEVQKTGGHKELIWFLYCVSDPIKESVKQSESSTNYSTDSMDVFALEHDDVGRFYTLIDSEDEEITKEMIENFFKKVQTTDIISAE